MTTELDWAICPHTFLLMAVDSGGYSHRVDIPAVQAGRYACNQLGQLLYRNRAGTCWRVLRYGAASGYYHRARCDRHKMHRALKLLPLPLPLVPQ